MADLTTRDDIVAALRLAGFTDAAIDHWIRFEPLPIPTPTVDPDQVPLFPPAQDAP